MLLAPPAPQEPYTPNTSPTSFIWLVSGCTVAVGVKSPESASRQPGTSKLICAVQAEDSTSGHMYGFCIGGQS